MTVWCKGEAGGSGGWRLETRLKDREKKEAGGGGGRCVA